MTRAQKIQVLREEIARWEASGEPWMPFIDWCRREVGEE